MPSPTSQPLAERLAPQGSLQVRVPSGATYAFPTADAATRFADAHEGVVLPLTKES